MQDFRTYLLSCLGSVYVWGGQGETIPGEAWIRAKEAKQGESAVRRAVTFYQRRVAALRALGREDDVKRLRAFDCSGLIVRYMLDAGLTKADMTAAGLYSKCVKFAAKDVCAGDLVFRHNGERITHVGVYMGDGTVIEARGRDYGVVRTAFMPVSGEYGDADKQERVNASGWTHFGRIVALSNCWGKEDEGGADGGCADEVSVGCTGEGSADGGCVGGVGVDGDSTGGGDTGEVGGVDEGVKNDVGAPPLPVLPCFAFVTGGSVNVREGAFVKSKALAVAHRGDLLIAGKTENGFAQAAVYICKMENGAVLRDGVPVAGYISEKYIKRLNG